MAACVRASWRIQGLCVCVYVYVFERERERGAVMSLLSSPGFSSARIFSLEMFSLSLLTLRGNKQISLLIAVKVDAI